MARSDGREPDQLRPLTITRNFIPHAEGSVFIELGHTRVVCTATVEDKVPPFLKGTRQGWITAEYGMLPRATPVRNQRESTKGKPSGRTQEIQRLIGRSLRSVVDLRALGERTIWIDCDVIQADGGTRTASITGSFIALVDALDLLRRSGVIEVLPVLDYLAATSVGILDGQAYLDLAFEEDSRAQVDMNVVMTLGGKLVEIQGTGEQAPFSLEEMQQLLALAQKGIFQLIKMQKEVLGQLGEEVGKYVPPEEDSSSNEEQGEDSGA